MTTGAWIILIAAVLAPVLLKLMIAASEALVTARENVQAQKKAASRAD